MIQMPHRPDSLECTFCQYSEQETFDREVIEEHDSWGDCGGALRFFGGQIVGFAAGWVTAARVLYMEVPSSWRYFKFVNKSNPKTLPKTHSHMLHLGCCSTGQDYVKHHTSTFR